MEIIKVEWKDYFCNDFVVNSQKNDILDYTIKITNEGEFSFRMNNDDSIDSIKADKNIINIFDDKNEIENQSKNIKDFAKIEENYEELFKQVRKNFDEGINVKTFISTPKDKETIYSYLDYFSDIEFDMNVNELKNTLSKEDNINEIQNNFQEKFDDNTNDHKKSHDDQPNHLNKESNKINLASSFGRKKDITIITDPLNNLKELNVKVDSQEENDIVLGYNLKIGEINKNTLESSFKITENQETDPNRLIQIDKKEENRNKNEELKIENLISTEIYDQFFKNQELKKKKKIQMQNDLSRQVIEYKNENKKVIDENKKLLEIMKLYKIIQNIDGQSKCDQIIFQKTKNSNIQSTINNNNFNENSALKNLPVENELNDQYSENMRMSNGSKHFKQATFTNFPSLGISLMGNNHEIMNKTVKDPKNNTQKISLTKNEDIVKKKFKRFIDSNQINPNTGMKSYKELYKTSKPSNLNFNQTQRYSNENSQKNRVNNTSSQQINLGEGSFNEPEFSKNQDKLTYINEQYEFSRKRLELLNQKVNDVENLTKLQKRNLGKKQF